MRYASIPRPRDRPADEIHRPTTGKNARPTGDRARASLTRWPERGGAEMVADAFDDLRAPYLPEPGQHFFQHEIGLEQIQILLQHRGGLVEDDQQQPGFADYFLGLHLPQVFDDGPAPLA